MRKDDKDAKKDIRGVRLHKNAEGRMIITHKDA